MENRKIIQSFVFFGFVAAFAAFGADKEQQDQVSQAEQSDSAGSKWGSYDGEPVTKWNPDGRTMTLLTELRYTDPNGNTWIAPIRSEEHTSELQSPDHLVCRLLLEKKK